MNLDHPLIPFALVFIGGILVGLATALALMLAGTL
jgi:hypothetical protein